MKTKSFNKKLSLNKQTVSSLNNPESTLAGGNTRTCIFCDTWITCYTCFQATCTDSCYHSTCYCSPKQNIGDPTYLNVTNKFNKTNFMETTGAIMGTIQCR